MHVIAAFSIVGLGVLAQYTLISTLQKHLQGLDIHLPSAAQR
jgi:hypothetical protein